MNSPLKNHFSVPGKGCIFVIKDNKITFITDLYNYNLNYNSISQKNQHFLNISVTFNKFFCSVETKRSTDAVIISYGVVDCLLYDNICKLFTDVAFIGGQGLTADDGFDYLVGA